MIVSVTVLSLLHDASAATAVAKSIFFSFIMVDIVFFDDVVD
jgi:hypothetical protein